MKMMWCVTCEQMVAIESPVHGHTIVQFVPDAGEQEVFWCGGEFVECAPDEYDPDFEINLEEPFSSEVFQMNLAAQKLLEDFIGIN
jgi:hypothetical protein